MGKKPLAAARLASPPSASSTWASRRSRRAHCTRRRAPACLDTGLNGGRRRPWVPLPEFAMKATVTLRRMHRIQTPLGGLTLAATDQGLFGAWFDEQSYRPDMD